MKYVGGRFLKLKLRELDGTDSEKMIEKLKKMKEGPDYEYLVRRLFNLTE